MKVFDIVLSLRGMIRKEGSCWFMGEYWIVVLVHSSILFFFQHTLDFSFGYKLEVSPIVCNWFSSHKTKKKKCIIFQVLFTYGLG